MTKASITVFQTRQVDDSFVQANSAFAHANAAYQSANNVAPQIQPAFNQANASYAHANAAFESANNVAPQIQPAFSKANSAYSQANSASLYANGAFIQANASFDLANTKLAQSGGTISGDLAITGNLVVSGSRVEISTANVLLQDNIVTINSDLPNNILPTEDSGIEINRGSSTNVSVIWNETTDKWTFTNDGTNYDNIGSSSTGVYANGAFTQANAAFAAANNVAPQIQPAFDKANSAGLYANAAFVQANAAYNAANTISLNKIYKNNTSVEVSDSNTTNSRIIFTVNNSPVGNISTSNVQITLATAATSTTTGALQVTGGASIGGSLYVGGTIYAVGDVVSSYSDERLKNKTKDVDDALTIISKLDAFYYTANDLACNYTRTDREEKVGLSAQQVQSVLPSVVSLASFDTEIDDNGNIASRTGQNYLTVDYARIVPVLIQAIKEQQKEIALLKEKINGIHNG